MAAESSATRKLKNKAKASLTLLLVAVISITTATYAWFSLSNTTVVQNMTVQVGTGTILKTSTVFSNNLAVNYTDSLDNAAINALIKSQTGGTVAKMEDIRLWPLTSGNGTKLYTQNTNSVAGSESINAANRYYLELPLWFMADEDMNVYLNAQDSPGKVGAEADGTLVSSSETEAKKKVVEKAVRISFAPYALNGGASSDNAANYTTAEAVTIYEPNKETATTITGNAKTDAGTATQPTFLQLGNNAGTGNTVGGAVKPTDPPVIFTLAKNVPKKVVIRLWIEGEDPECDNTKTTVNIEMAKVMVRLRFCGADNNGKYIEAGALS